MILDHAHIAEDSSSEQNNSFALLVYDFAL